MTDRRTTATDIAAFNPRPALLPQLSLVVIRARDPARLAIFYAGLGMTFHEEQHGAGLLHYISTDAGFTFEIYPRKAAEQGTQATRLGFATVAIEVVVNALTGAGGTIVTAPTLTEWGRRAVLIDPEGHKVELLERSNASRLPQ